MRKGVGSEPRATGVDDRAGMGGAGSLKAALDVVGPLRPHRRAAGEAARARRLAIAHNRTPRLRKARCSLLIEPDSPVRRSPICSTERRAVTASVT